MNNDNLLHQKLTEKSLLKDVFEKPIVLVSYDGNVLATEKIEVFKYDLKIDEQKATPKLIILFAFSFGEYEKVSIGIKLNQKVEDQKLKSIKSRSKRPVVATKEEYEAGHQQNIRITMRTGHILSGKQTHQMEYNLILKINGIPVLVYKHGILEYQIEH